MKRGVLVICDREENYARRLMDYMNRREKLFEICIFTAVEALLSYLTTHSVDILLIEEELWERRIAQRMSGKIILLSESGQVREEADCAMVYKFQAAENIEREIMNCYAEENIKFLPDMAVPRNVQLWGIFSPFGGCGKTTLALALAQKLVQRKNVLYLNLESFGGLVGESGFRSGMTDLLYYVKERKENLFLLLSSLTEKQKQVDCIFPVDYYCDLLSITEEDFDFLLQQLEKSTYEIVILDISCTASWVFYLLSKCNRIFMPRLREENSSGKLMALERSLRMEEREEVLTKIEYVLMPHLQGAEMEKLLWQLANDD